jgi:hypothetical protein
MVFEIRLLRGIFGPMRDEVTGHWKMSLIIFNVQVVLSCTDQGGCSRLGM